MICNHKGLAEIMACPHCNLNSQQEAQRRALQGVPVPATTAAPVGRKEQRVAFLEKKRAVTIEDLKMKTEGEDWHGCADAAMDLRDIDNELDGLRF